MCREWDSSGRHTVGGALSALLFTVAGALSVFFAYSAARATGVRGGVSYFRRSCMASGRAGGASFGTGLSIASDFARSRKERRAREPSPLELGGNCAIPGHCGSVSSFSCRAILLGRTWLVSSCAARSLTFFRSHACRGISHSFVVADDAVYRGRPGSQLWADALPRRGEVMYGSCNVETATVPTVRGAGLPSSCRANRSHGGSAES
jgi:hypothetical protein